MTARVCWLTAWAASLLAGCSGGGSAGGGGAGGGAGLGASGGRAGGGATGAGGGEALCTGMNGVVVTRVVPHLGGGHELTVRLDTASGVPAVEPGAAACLGVETSGTTVAATAAAHRRVERTYTLLLVDPGESEEQRAAALAIADAIVQARPAGDRVAVYRWGARPTQVVTFTVDRALIAARTAAGMPVAGSEIASATTALLEAGVALAAVGGLGEDAMRALVVVSARPRADLDAPAIAAAAPALVLWAGPVGLEPAGVRPGLAFGFGEDRATPAAAVARTIEAYRTRAFFAIGVCGDGKAGEARVRVAGAGASTPLAAASPEIAAGACDAARIAAGERPFPRTVELLMTSEQAAVEERAHADRTKEWFPLSIKVSPDHAAVGAMAHHRGESSLACARRSYSVNLDGGERRFPFPGAAQDEFHLIALCLDRLYVRNFSNLTLMAQEDLMPVPFDLVELKVNGVSRGVYLMTENVPESLKAHTARPIAVVRRRKVNADVSTFPEMKWSATTEAAALAAYDRILSSLRGLSGNELLAAARARFDLDQYLRWMALMAAIGSGDYIDEVFFYAAETTLADGTHGEHFRISSWDQDDPYASCHLDGRGAMYDPHGLLICAEAELDKALLVDPVVYERYVQILDDLLDRLTVDRYAAVLHDRAARILQRVRDPAVLGAMVELAAIAPAAAQSYDVAAALMVSDVELLTSQFATQRNLLKLNIARYRATKAP